MGESEGCLDRETLNLILRDPLEFGLHDENINHLIQFQNMIEAKVNENARNGNHIRSHVFNCGRDSGKTMNTLKILCKTIIICPTLHYSTSKWN